MAGLVTKLIREKTGLKMSEFCETYLDSDWRAFATRLRRNKLYPNEAILICLLTGRNPSELFGLSTAEVFFLKGKDKVRVRVKEILEQPNSIDKVNLIFNDPAGIYVTDIVAGKYTKKIKKVRGRPRKKAKEVEPSEVDETEIEVKNSGLQHPVQTNSETIDVDLDIFK